MFGSLINWSVRYMPSPVDLAYKTDDLKLHTMRKAAQVSLRKRAQSYVHKQGWSHCLLLWASKLPPAHVSSIVSPVSSHSAEFTLAPALSWMQSSTCSHTISWLRAQSLIVQGFRWVSVLRIHLSKGHQRGVPRAKEGRDRLCAGSEKEPAGQLSCGGRQTAVVQDSREWGGPESSTSCSLRPGRRYRRHPDKKGNISAAKEDLGRVTGTRASWEKKWEAGEWGWQTHHVQCFLLQNS